MIAALLLQLGIQGLLAQRQVRYVHRHRDSVPEPFASQVPLEAHRKAAAYAIGKARLGMVEASIGAVLLLGWTLGGGLELLDRAWRTMHWPAIPTGVGFLLSLWVLHTLLHLPLELARTFGLEQRFGFNRVTPGLFCSDLAKKAVLGLLLGAPLFALLLWIMQGAVGGDLWWLYVWLVWMGFSLSLTWAWPIFFAPWFNRFRPLENDSLRARIDRLLSRNGFAGREIFVMDGSARSTHGNAYFTGFGAARRIVFFDTLMDELEEEEIEAVLAHELGHYKCRHIVQRIALLGALGLAGMAVLGWLFDTPWFYAGLGVERSSPYQALALFGLVAPVFLYFLQPVFARISRQHEFEADDFAAGQAPVQALRRALVKLYRDNANTLTPDPWHSAFHDSHPSPPARLAYLTARAS